MNTCQVCNKPLTETQIKRHITFCSKACATSYRCAAHDPNFFNLDNKHIVYYILGLIITDGNISSDYKKLTLSLTDRRIIEMLSDFIIDKKKRKIYSYNPLNCQNASTIYSLINTNPETIVSLCKLNITPQKTYTQTFPDIPEQYVYDFLRGVFDGNGCVYISNKKANNMYYAISFTSGSLEFTNGLSDSLKRLGYFPTIAIDSRRKNNEHKTYYIRLSKQSDVSRFMDNIYKQSYGYYIQRKHDKYYNKNIV